MTSSLEQLRYQLHMRMKLFQLAFVMLVVAVSVVAGKKGKKVAAALEVINNRLAAIEKSLKQSKECLTNVAFGKPVSLSSIYEEADGSYAVNGQKTGIWNDGYCAHTLTENNPWLQIDLEGSYVIKGMQIFKRTDCCLERLRNLHIEVGVSPDDLSEVYYYDGVAPNILEINFNKTVVGRYLKFWIEATDETLNICEIEVYGVHSYENVQVD